MICTEASGQEEVEVESLLESLKTSIDESSLIPTCISSKVFSYSRGLSLVFFLCVV